MYPVLLLLAVASGPLLYVLMSLVFPRATTYEDYHYAGRTVPRSEFVSTTVAYALQVAAIALFATWGYMYGLWALLVPLFWAAGYWLLAHLVKIGRTDTFLTQNSLGTVHQFLADRHRVRGLAVVAAIASAIGIAGPAMFEAFCTGDILSRLIADLGQASNQERFVNQYTVLFAAGFLLVAAIYMLYGGFRSVVVTDAAQLAVGYACFSLVLAYLLYRIGTHGHFLPSLLLLLFLLIVSLVTFTLFGFAFRTRLQRWDVCTSLSALLAVVLAYLTALIAILLTNPGGIRDVLSYAAWASFAQEQNAGHPLAMGTTMLLNLLIANGLYQLVDIGQWQRLGAVAIDVNAMERSRGDLARAIRMTMVYTAVTWAVAVVFGITLRYASPAAVTNPYDALALFMLELQRSGAWIDRALVLLLCTSLVAIMLSTLDSLVSCIAFTIHNDLLVSWKQQLRRLSIGRLTTGALLLVFFISYAGLRQRVTTFSDILYACWSMQIALFWVVVFALFRLRIVPSFAVCSVVGGMVAALVPIFVGAPLSTYEHGSIFALGVSGCIAAAGIRPRASTREGSNANS